MHKKDAIDATGMLIGWLKKPEVKNEKVNKKWNFVCFLRLIFWS